MPELANINMERSSNAPKRRLAIEIKGRNSGLGAGGVVKHAVKNRKPRYHGYAEAGKALISEEIDNIDGYRRHRSNSIIPGSVIGPENTTSRYIHRACG